MIPIALNVRNFMCYTDVHQPLRFDGIHVAVLAGDNGHGKSALLDAITWALWGRSRARGVDDLIHTGATEMEVEFEFELDDLQYRVIRKRQRRGKTGISDLQFAVLADGGYRSITERSLVETERAIERTLHMSYDTFTSSSFIQQGRADSFTTSSPAERKRVLAEILQLGDFDELEARAKAAYDERESGLRDERRRSREWEIEIARRPEYQADADRLKGELAVAGERIAALVATSNAARERVAHLEAAQRQLAEVQERLARYEADRQRLGSQLGERRAALAETRTILGRAEAVEAAFAELTEARGALSDADRRLQAHLPLAQSRDRALAAIDTERARFEAELASRQRALADLAQTLARGKTATTEIRAAASLVESVLRAQKRHESLLEMSAQTRETIAGHRASNGHLKDSMRELRAQIDALDGLATCPVCQRPVEAEHKERLRAGYRVQGVALRDRFRSQEKACQELELLAKQQDTELHQLADRLAGREDALRKLALLEGAVVHAQEAQQQEALLRGEIVQYETALAEGAHAPEARRAVADLDRRIADVAYDTARHDLVRARAAELVGAEDEKRRLDQARLVAEHLTTQVEQLHGAVERIDTECTAERSRQAALVQEVAALGQERARLQALDDGLRAAQAEQSELRVQHMQATARVDNCVLLEKNRAESLQRQDCLMREHGIFSDLAHAFGRKGVQAMLIESALPEIEDEANHILARMTQGRMNVKIETQREGRTGGTIETLDIKIADELGTRSYEMFSGGEGFRVNFAIRIALSRLLAHRAGTKLQTLVVDEGFGSQDQEGRDRIVEAIQAIQDEFAKILVITHLEDLRERFPVRIEVRKTPRGSVFALT